MASSFNLTIDDSSPLILYEPSGAWQDALSTDTAGLAYTGGTLHTTAAPGATATINFNGTGISIYGGRRPEYGRYTMTVDGSVIVDSTATDTGIEVQQVLGSASGLTNGQHTAVLTCTGVGMDIDWVNVDTQIGSAGSTTTSTVFDDTNSALTYVGPWDTSDKAIYLNSTLHYTQAAGAAASLAFSGNAVAIYGTVSPTHNNIQVSIDGKTTMVNGGSTYTTALHAQTLLYYANDLDASQHMLIITNPAQQTGGPFIDLDSITVYSASSLDPTPSALANQAAGTSSSSRSGPSSALSTKAMIGIVVGVVFVVLVLLAVIMLLVLRRKRRAQRQTMDVDPKTPVDAELPLQAPNMRFTPISPQQPMPTFSRLATRTSMHSIAPSYYASNNASSSSFDSTTPMMLPPDVPTLGLPRVPTRAPSRSGAQQGLMVSPDAYRYSGTC
ncbi:hypothetical protein B0H17DRAFT_1063272 [Mycena rosella]|uniref:Transmembrane protein n=1 Tax=Mycena rosella TaxID=1033263 RepID=A0AAD7GHK7_MYCRO|nr:hypothetical protein B0H17DRAFT_1063272 [Mycena rosella]